LRCWVDQTADKLCCGGFFVTKQSKILVVDDQEETMDCLVKCITHAYPQFEVTGRTDGLQALLWLQEYSTDMLITDLRMPRYGGLEVIMETLAQNSQTPIIAMSALSGLEEVRMVARRFTSLRMLAKPFMMGELFDTMDSLMSSPPESVARGFQAITMLQLMHLEGRSCRMELKTEHSFGELCFEEGELTYVRFTGSEGEEAFFAILKMENPVIKLFRNNAGYPRNVTVPIDQLLLEHCRCQDELKSFDLA
jgi:DNA-binding response OmpR family regulator